MKKDSWGTFLLIVLLGTFFPVDLVAETSRCEVVYTDPKVTAMAEASKITGVKLEHLVAVSLTESQFCKYLVGWTDKDDRGCFQLNIRYHPAALPILGDVQKEAEYAGNFLQKLGYSDNVTTTFARYNRPARPNYAYAQKVINNLSKARLLLTTEKRCF